MNSKINVFINQTKYELTNPVQTGRALKDLAGIPHSDVLFLQQPHEDLVVANDSTITLKNGAHLHSQPPADYGLEDAGVGGGDPPGLGAAARGARPPGLEVERLGLENHVESFPQKDGWTFVVIHGYELPSPYTPSKVRLLVKLPPLFPEAQPDMFWVSPSVLAGKATPKGVSSLEVMGETWQQYSWHLKPGAWKPGKSQLRDWIRCIRARFERRD